MNRARHSPRTWRPILFAESDTRRTIYLSLVGDFTEAQRGIIDLTQAYLAFFFEVPASSCQTVTCP
jgi:hypothetical protein